MKDLTFRYCATQFTFWAASSGASSFATAFLLSKGLSSGFVGTLLAAAGLLSCATQSLLGILFLGIFHAMTENYLIVIMERLGGGSGHVGNALFISAITGSIVIFGIGFIRRRVRDTALLKTAAVSFLIKALLLYLARDIGTIYLVQLLQMTSYAFLAPAQVFYAKEKVRPADMVKGQSFVTAAYALGCAGGNFTGGQLLSGGAEAILTAGIAMALAGTVVIFLTVDRSDRNGDL